MRLKRYLKEGEFGTGEAYKGLNRKTPMSKEEAKEFLHKHCKKSLFSTPIWRGTNSPGDDIAFLIQPSKFNRASRNTSNHYTLLLDNSPKWKDYPKRSKSVICTTSHHTASLYGTNFRVFPVDGSKIGLCPSSDFWGSFDDYKPMDMFNTELVKLLKEVNYTMVFLKDKYPEKEKDPMFAGYPKNKFNNYKEAISYQALLDGFDFIDSKKPLVKDIALKQEGTGLWYTTNYLKLHDYWEQSHIKLIDHLEFTLSPRYNAFDLVNAGDNFHSRGDAEVWTDGDCLMIQASALHIDDNWFGAPTRLDVAKKILGMEDE